MSKIGVFLGFAPNQRIADQGMGRLLGFILNGMIANDAHIVIACPGWYLGCLNEFVNDQKLDSSHIEIIHTSGLPFWLRFLYFMSGLRQQQNARNAGKSHRNNSRVTNFLRKFRHHYLVNYIYQKLRKYELKKLCSLANKQTEVTAWYVPSPFWPEIKYLKARKVVAIPDVVMLEYPEYFSSQHWQNVLSNIRTIAKTADAVICYTAYVKQKHLIEGLGLPANKVKLIKHGFIDSKHYLAEDFLTSQDKAVAYVNHYLTEVLNHSVSIDKQAFKYLFYASQVRPYKNFKSLIKALAIIVHQFQQKVVLITTGNLNDDLSLLALVDELKIKNNILSLPNIPSDILAALNCIADLSVNPTLFEGGFPFTFSEAYSVGTPSILSKIPMVLDEIDDPAQFEPMLMDPHDPNEMAKKIAWGVDNRDKLVRLQLSLFKKMVKRDWQVAAHAYIKLLTYKESMPVATAKAI